MITKTPKKILLADDSVFFRAKLSTILTEAGHEVRLSSDGNEVISEIKTHPDDIDLLILDLQMPELDGFGVLEWIDKNKCRDKFDILIITGAYELSTIIERLKAHGVMGVMTKGYTAEQVVYRVNRLLFKENFADKKPDRAPVSIPVDFSLADKRHSGLLLNISHSGVFLHTIMNLTEDTKLDIIFSLYGYDRVFNLPCEVVWSTPPSGPTKLFTGAGVRFLEIASEEEEIIKDFVDKEQQLLVSIED